MADLEAVIATPSSFDDTVPISELPDTLGGEEPMVAVKEATHLEDSVATSHDEELGIRSDWPPSIGEHIAANFSDGFYVGEVTDIVDSSIVKVSYMSPKTILTADHGEHSRRF